MAEQPGTGQQTRELVTCLVRRGRVLAQDLVDGLPARLARYARRVLPPSPARGLAQLFLVYSARCSRQRPRPGPNVRSPRTDSHPEPLPRCAPPARQRDRWLPDRHSRHLPHPGGQGCPPPSRSRCSGSPVRQGTRRRHRSSRGRSWGAARTVRRAHDGQSPHTPDCCRHEPRAPRSPVTPPCQRPTPKGYCDSGTGVDASGGAPSEDMLTAPGYSLSALPQSTVSGNRGTALIRCASSRFAARST